MDFALYCFLSNSKNPLDKSEDNDVSSLQVDQMYENTSRTLSFEAKWTYIPHLHQSSPQIFL